MALMPFNGVLDVLEHRVLHLLPPRAFRNSLARGDDGTLLGPETARAALYSRQADGGLRQRIWSQAVASAQEERRVPRGEEVRRDGPAQLFLLWLAIPFMRRTACRIAARFRLDVQDAESEMTARLLEIVGSADPEEPELGRVLLREMSRSAWRLARQAVQEKPAADIAGVRAARRDRRQDDPAQAADDQWDVHITPPAQPDGLRACVRFTASRTARVEEQRLEALGRRLGLEDVVYRARRPQDGPPIGRLSLLPSGDRR